MSSVCRVRIGKKTIELRAGDRLRDAAMKAGLARPHACRPDQCDACLLRVLSGEVIGGGTRWAGVVRACQAIVLTDLQVEAVAGAEADVGREASGEVVAIRLPSRDVAEVTVATGRPFAWSAGQYANVRFEGFPERSYCPTVALDGRDLPGTFRLHVKLIPGGLVSSAIGRGIRRGHRVDIHGPFGRTALKSGPGGRLGLFAGGTGFAPIWSIADQALRESPGRPLLMVVGVKAITCFYMAEALERLARCPNVAVVPVVEEPQSLVPHIATGRVADLAHLMQPGDTVCAGGASAMVESLRVHAARLDLPFHAHAFEPSPPVAESWMTRVAERFGASRRRLAVVDMPRSDAWLATPVRGR